MLLIDGGDNIRVVNNTSLNAGTAIYATGHAVTGFLLENNIFDYGDFGIMGDGASPGKGTLTTWFPGSVVLGNVMPDNTQPWTFPVGNSYPANWAAVGFVDLAGGNYRLAPTSAYIAAGTGGSTPGADVDALETALSGGPLTPPACTFSVAPSSHDSPAGGDTFSVGVTASDASCAWSVSAAPWVTPSATGGTGSGTVVLTVSPNATTAPRSASVMVADSAVAVTQAPVCAFTVAPVARLSGGRRHIQRRRDRQRRLVRLECVSCALGHPVSDRRHGIGHRRADGQPECHHGTALGQRDGSRQRRSRHPGCAGRGAGLHVHPVAL